MGTTWEYSGANVTQRLANTDDEPSRELQVHVRVEAFSEIELHERDLRRQKEEEQQGAAQEVMAADVDQPPNEEQPPAPPSLEELGCIFSLQLLAGAEETSAPLADERITAAEASEAVESQEEDEEAATAGAEEASRRLLFQAGHDGVCYRSFKCPALFDEDTCLSVCEGAIPSSIKLVKEGVELLVLPLDLAQFVAGERRQETWCSLEQTELSRAPYNLKGFTVLIMSEADVLSRSLRRDLNPMRITIVSVADVPAHDTSGRTGQEFEHLHDVCRPAFCRYDFLSSEVETHGMIQARHLAFKAVKVYCVGKRAIADLQQYLKQNKLVVHFYDREPLPIHSDMEEDDGENDGENEGEVLEDGGTENAGQKRRSRPEVWSGLRSVDRARAEEPTPATPHGIAQIDLSPLVQNASDRLTQTAMVVPERATHTSLYQQRRFPAAFLEAGTTLTVQADLSYPLQESEERGNFQRVVLVMPYADSERLSTLEEIVLRRNCAALDGVQSVPLDASLDPLLRKKSIAAVQLSAEQQVDCNLDFISGFQLIDGDFRIFVLEGLVECKGYTNLEGEFTADVNVSSGDHEAAEAAEELADGSKRTVRSGAMMELLEALPRRQPNGSGDGTKIFTNPDITFGERLYGEFNAEILKVKLRASMKKLLTRQDIGLEPKYEPTLTALSRLFAMLKTSRLIRHVRSTGFPPPATIRQLHKKFGTALSVTDIEGVPQRSVSSLMTKAGGQEQLSVEEVMQASKDLPGRPRRAPPTDATNWPYQQFKTLKAKAGPADYIEENKEWVAKLSEQSAMRAGLKQPRPSADWVDGDGSDIYVYGSQYLSFTDMHRKVVQARLQRDEGKVHYTYSKDFLSGAFVMQDPADAERRERQASKEKMRTPSGFRVVQPSKASEFRTHASDWGDPRRSRQVMMSGIELDNINSEWIDPGIKGVTHDLDFQEAGRGCQRHPERPLAQTVHDGQPFRRYTGLGSQAAPSQYRLQGGVFGHPNEGFMDSVHTKGGGELERMERVAAEQENFRSKIKGDRKFMMALLKQPDRLSQIDRYGLTALRDPPRTHAGRTLLQKPEGTVLPYPPSVLGKEPWKDPALTSTVLKYGASLRFQADVDGTDKTISFDIARAVGVKDHIVRPSIHSQNFFHRKTGPRDSSDHIANRIRFPAIGHPRAGAEPGASASSNLKPPSRRNPRLWA